MTRVSVRAKSYRGEEGFLVSARDASGRLQRVFCLTKEGASLIKEAFRSKEASSPFEPYLRTLMTDPETESIPLKLRYDLARTRALEARLEAEAVVSSVLLSGY